eukprot:7391605-Prymnesium_polylepis.8
MAAIWNTCSLHQPAAAPRRPKSARIQPSAAHGRSRSGRLVLLLLGLCAAPIAAITAPATMVSTDQGTPGKQAGAHGPEAADHDVPQDAALNRLSTATATLSQSSATLSGLAVPKINSRALVATCVRRARLGGATRGVIRVQIGEVI